MEPREKDEIEITPEMIKAGYQVLLASGLGDAILRADKCTVAEIYRAMASLRPPAMVLVPRHPTKEMLDEAWADAHAEDARGVWDSMIEAWLRRAAGTPKR